MVNPWDIKVDGFVKCKTERQRLSYLVSYAILAPSTHNSQPWQFLIGNDCIELSPDFSRWLKHSDPSGRQMWLSLGCALENLLISADFFGYDCGYEIKGEMITIKLKRELAGRYDDQHLIFSIPKRVTSRYEQKASIIDENLKKEILSNAGNVAIDIIEDKSGMLACAQETSFGTINAFSIKKFRFELSRYLKNNLTKSKIGMPMFGMGIDTLPSFFAPLLLRFINPGKIFAKKASELITNNTGGIVIFSTKNDNMHDWLEVGRVFQRSALLATKCGYSLSPLAASIEFGDRNSLKNIISKSDLTPQMFARLGLAKKSPRHSPRLLLSEIAKYV